MDSLPLNLKTPLSIAVYKDLYRNVDFLKNKTPQFIGWICPLLRSRVATPDEVIYYEGDELQHVYFLKSGQCKYVLPKYANTPYIQIVDHSCFGLIDIIVALMEKAGTRISQEGIMAVLDPEEDPDNEENKSAQTANDTKFIFSSETDLRRSFTVRSFKDGPAELLSIGKQDLLRMKIEFRTNFKEFFLSGVSELEKMITVKMYAMELCDRRYKEWEKMNIGIPNYDVKELTNK